MESGQEFAIRTGFSPSKVSRAERGITSLSERDIQIWAITCAAEEQIPELIAVRRQVAQLWTEYRAELRAAKQGEVAASVLPIYSSASLVRIYESLHVPGILQTADYSRHQRLIWAQLHGLPIDDVDDAVRNRLASQVLVTHGGGPTFSFLLEATVLYNVLGDPEVMSQQFDLLLAVTAKAHVVLGVIPLGTPRMLFPGEGFYLFDEHLLIQEFWSGRLRTSQTTEMAYFGKVFNLLRRQAVYKDAARREIEAARSYLQERARP